MKIARTAAELQNLLPTDAVSALIPTMGGLHEGHLSLVRKARKIADYAVVSIYVNPLQFGPNEDFGEYPRDLADDCEKLRDLADVVFAPDDAEIYPTTQSVRFSLPPIADELCGASRPGFFHGVATVCGQIIQYGSPLTGDFRRKRLSAGAYHQNNDTTDEFSRPNCFVADNQRSGRVGHEFTQQLSQRR